MTTINSILSALDERVMAGQIAIPHDNARVQYSLHSNTVGSFHQFSDVISNYYNYHYTSCVSNGGNLSLSEAGGRAKELLEKEYRKRQGDIVSAFNDAHDGTNGGMRVVLDTIAEGLKAESLERYIRDVFDRHVTPNSWDQKVEIIRQFISQCGTYLSSTIRADQPERYAQDYNELIRSYMDGLQRTSSMFRRL
jgi:hypothetical protein